MGTPIPPHDHKISVADAATLTRQYQQTKEYARPFPILAFHRDGYARILNQSGCVAIRAYPGQHEDGALTLVLVGVDDKGNDMVDGELAQQPFECPPTCSDSNVLNGAS
jgi:hypothetical protein